MATSGIARILPVLAATLLPGGRVFWNAGFGNTWLKPPPASIQPTSRAPGCAGHWPDGADESTCVPVAASMQRYVPPTAVTSGSPPGHEMFGDDMSGLALAPPAGVLATLVLPKSPVEARTLTLCATADLNAPRRFSRAARPLNVCSEAPKLWLMTCARPWSMRYCSEFIICGSPWTPRVSAVGVVTSSTFALGATACTHSTSRETSTIQPLRSSLPGSFAVGGGLLVSVHACTQRMLNVGSPGAQV